MPLPPPAAPTATQLEQLHDRLWNDPRRRDDRSEFHECEACGAAVRWIANRASAHGSALPIVTQVVASAIGFDADHHVGLVATFTDRTGFTVSRHTTIDEVEGSLLYRCHWDSCAHAREKRDRISKARRARDAAQVDLPHEDPDALRRYESWRRAPERFR